MSNFNLKFSLVNDRETSISLDNYETLIDLMDRLDESATYPHYAFDMSDGSIIAIPSKNVLLIEIKEVEDTEDDED